MIYHILPSGVLLDCNSMDWVIADQASDGLCYHHLNTSYSLDTRDTLTDNQTPRLLRTKRR